MSFFTSTKKWQKWPLGVEICDTSRWIVDTGIPLLLRFFDNIGILLNRLVLPKDAIGVERFSLLAVADNIFSNPYFDKYQW